MSNTTRDPVSDGRRSLWAAVINQALVDATGNINSLLSEVEREEARDYFLSPNRDFNRAGSLADLDPVAVRDHARVLITKAKANDEARTPTERANRCRTLDHDGKSMTIAEWADHLGLSIQCIHTRLHKRMPMEKVLHKGRLDQIGHKARARHPGGTSNTFANV